jgi:non-ribosomal peptide synthetase component E (peptide arylation enzyme)
MKVQVRPSPAEAEQYRSRGLWSERLIDAFLSEHAADPGRADRPVVVDADASLTYTELEGRVEALAASLADLGAAPGEVVSWQLPNWWEAVALHLAIIRLGAVSNPIIAIYRRSEVQFILAQAQSKIFVVPERFRGFDFPGMVAEMRPELPALDHLVIARASGPAQGIRFEEMLKPGTPPEPERSAVDPAILLYTSGTTAEPKGVVHPHATLVRELAGFIDLYDLTAEDPVFMPSPVTHVTGLLYAMQMPSMLGSFAVLQDVWEPTEALKLLERHRCAFTVSATPFLHGLTYHPELHEYDLSAMRVFCCGGADVPPQLIRDAEDRLGCLATRVYGSTEYPTAGQGGPTDPLAKRAETDGRPLAGTELRIVGEDGGILGPGEVGELHVRGPERFSGYLQPPPDGPVFDAEGFFATGDMASLDADGYLTISGRKKDIILRGGENISVKEVEDLLFVHPAIDDVAIVAMPDPVMVERACAYLVIAPGAEAPSLSELTEYLQGRGLAIQKVPERLEVVEQLPKNLAGKVQKFKLREAIREQLAAEDVIPR